eukprot:4104009-Alexandrium_andersonii.AAC.1
MPHSAAVGFLALGGILIRVGRSLPCAPPLQSLVRSPGSRGAHVKLVALPGGLPTADRLRH